MTYLFYDTETTGVHSKARMTQLAFVLFEEDGTIIEEYQAFTKPSIYQTRWLDNTKREILFR
jgi:DNA polymerase III epsilon subunit-like protein